MFVFYNGGGVGIEIVAFQTESWQELDRTA